MIKNCFVQCSWCAIQQVHSEYYRWQTKVTTLEFLTIGMYATTFTIDRHFCRRSRATNTTNIQLTLCPTLSMNSFYFIVYITNKYIKDVLYRYRETFWDFFCVSLFGSQNMTDRYFVCCTDFNQHIYPDYTANYFKYLHEIVFISDII